MSKEHIYLYFHLVGVFLLVGAAGFSTVAGIIAGRTRDLRVVATLLRLQRQNELLVTSLGALIVVVFGSLLVDPSGNKMSDAWIGAAWALIIIVLGLDHGVLMRGNRKARARAEELLASGTPESDEPARMMSTPLMRGVGVLLDLSYLLFLYLMIYRPGS